MTWDETTNNEIGLLIEPIIDVSVLYSRTTLVKVMPHARNIKDSYKLLKGKYP
jgi:hypothetical protein